MNEQLGDRILTQTLKRLTTRPALRAANDVEKNFKRSDNRWVSLPHAMLEAAPYIIREPEAGGRIAYLQAAIAADLLSRREFTPRERLQFLGRAVVKSIVTSK